jgi:hypothetical protein
MFVDETLKNHFETSSTISLNSLVLVEWNMNMPDNIFKVGNYRYRPQELGSEYFTLIQSFDATDSGNYYTGATESNIIVENGYTDEDIPQMFLSVKEKEKLFYSLQDCLAPFRPRSGINKPLYFSGRYLANSGANMAERPRYYMPSRYDQFKYWTSYRTESNKEYGISNTRVEDEYYISDAAPFVVYKEEVPTNRIVVKMQTNVGDIDLGPFQTSTESIDDPLYGDQNKTVPVKWKIQYLKNNNWVDAYSFDQNTLRDDGTPAIKSDGYIELEFGAIIPEEYQGIFFYAQTISSVTLLPSESIIGYTYHVIENEGDAGTFYIWNGSEYKNFPVVYGWKLGSEAINNNTDFVTDFTSPSTYVDYENNSTLYREFIYIKGLRIVAETMNKFDCTFDLIEMSPRLVANISNKVIDYKITKVLSDIGNTSLPVGQLLASTGEVNIFDEDQSFNYENTSSIINKYIRKNIKFNFYENILNVEGFNYYVPIKTLYSDGMPQADVTASTLNLSLRDFYFYFESMTAPRILLTNVSLSYAVSVLLDSIGFTNYSFKRTESDNDPVIPYFFIAPDQNVAEVLNQLAISTQSAMFFDEYNNFIVMSKNYIMPSEQDRSTDFVLIGNNNQSDEGVIENQSSGNLPNILQISSKDKKIYNDGKINYTTRYIQRSYGSVRQSSLIDKEKTWIYKPVLLWEVAGTENTKTVNELASRQGNYVLGAMPINSDIPNVAPTVINNILTNNVIDLGENVYWLTRYQGYFYSNGEIIKYDAAEFNITGIGNVWISSNQEYQKYFSSLAFNGKIYPTGLVRIYSKPYYETANGTTRLKNGEVESHGRAQFGTTISNHSSGLPSYWSNNDYVRACEMSSNYLFTTEIDPTLPSTEVGSAGVNNTISKQTTRNGVIKNFMAVSNKTETTVNSFQSTQSGTIQSSALVMNGPSFKTTEVPLNYVSYVYKNLDNAYRHFGTRMRIVGKVENNLQRFQTPFGSTSYYQVNGSNPSQSVTIGGGSGGLAVMINPETNNGYYFEIVALTENNVESYLNINSQGQSEIQIHNIIFYKIKKESGSSKAIPVKLWGGLSSILVDDGNFTGQYRMTGEENPTVYDLSIEYENIGTKRRFYLYVNNKLIKVVDDNDPLPVYNNMALFVRGSSRCMFENIYAISKNYSQNTVSTISPAIQRVFGQTENSSAYVKETGLFGDNEINLNESFRKYAMSGVVQSTYLSGISAQQPPKYNMYFEEFGSIMRECSYFNIKYDRAYPALYAKLSPTFNRIKGYVVSGFYADSYGAEFLIFNSTDKSLVLDETSGNYLRIQGITFTQDTTHTLSVDEYYSKRSNLSDPELKGTSVVYSPLIEQQKYDNIKLSRLTYGKNDFSIDTPYIQTEDDANALMGWITEKLMTPKKNIGLNVFANPTLQLGDIVTVDYKDNNNVNMISSTSSRFIIYNIEYSRSSEGPSMALYLSEV